VTSEKRAQRLHDEDESRYDRAMRKAGNQCARCGNCELWHSRIFFMRTSGGKKTCKLFKASS
jgi:hypothetical protein